MKKIFFLILLTITINANIRVAAASNITYAMDELKKSFLKSHPNSKIFVTIGSSGNLRAQIEHGAPFDIFLSANIEYAKALADKNLTKSKAIIYAKGALILYTKKKLNLKDGLNILTSKDVSKIAIANPKTAPYGKAAKEALINAKLFNKIKDKLIYAQNISQTLIYTLRACDVGFIAKSALFSKELKGAKEGVNYIDVPKNLYKPISQAMVLISDKKEAKEFFIFLQSKEAKEIFQKFGYISD